MFRFLNFFKRRTKYLAVSNVLSNVLTPAQFQRVFEKCPDRRDIIAAAAAEMGLSEEELTLQLATRLNVPIALRIEPIRLSASLKEKTSLSELRALGSILLLSGNTPLGIATADPLTASALCSKIGLQQIYMAPWSVIRNALERSEEGERHAASIVASTSSGTDKLKNAASKLLDALIGEVLTHGASTFEIAHNSGNETSYRFTSSEGRQGVGPISSLIERPLFTLLEELSGSSSPSVVTYGSDGKKSEVSVTRSSENHFIVSLCPSVQKKPRTPALEVIAGSKGTQKAEITSQEEQGEANRTYAGGAVVLVEDNTSFAMLLGKMLAKSGIELTHFSAADAALNALAVLDVQRLPELIICDLHMYPTNGVEFLKKLKALPHLSSIAVLMLTSDNQDTTQVLAMEEGADAFVAKQEAPSVLLANIKRLLKRRLSRSA